MYPEMMLGRIGRGSTNGKHAVPAGPHAGPSARHKPRSRGWARRSWRAYAHGWLWYQHRGYAPPGDRDGARPRHDRRAAPTVGSRPPASAPREPVAFSRRGALLGARLSVPFTIASLAYGVVFGVLARQVGLGAGEALLMSGTVAAGAAQMVVLELWASPLPVLAIVLTTLLINLRYVLLGAAFPAWFSALPARERYGSAFFMFDESWAVAMRRFRDGDRDAAVMLGSGLAMFAAWISGTLLGHGFGSLIRDPRTWGLDFLVTAALLTLLVGFWNGRRSSLRPWLSAAAVGVVTSQLIPGSWYILAGGIAGSIVGGILNDT